MSSFGQNLGGRSHVSTVAFGRRWRMSRLLKGPRVVRMSLAMAVMISGVVGLAMAASLSATASTTTRQIAASTLGHDFRVVLTAVRGSGGAGAPPATVKITAYERSGDRWKSIGRQTVGDPNAWFWNVVTGPGTICRFSTS